MKISGKRIMIIRIVLISMLTLTACAYKKPEPPPAPMPEPPPEVNLHTLDDIYDAVTSIIMLNGDAQAEDVLSGKIFSNSTAMGITGTMPDNGMVTITPGTEDQPIPAGYHNGSGSVAGDEDLTVKNIKPGVEIFGVTGLRWYDPGDGTVKDMSTGLVWLKKANWGGAYPLWTSAMKGTTARDRAAQLWDDAPDEGKADLSDGSVEGSWRLPTLEELKGLMNGAEPVSVKTPQLFTGVKNSYWSGTACADKTAHAWAVSMDDGKVSDKSKLKRYYVWPVRSGKDE